MAGNIEDNTRVEFDLRRGQPALYRDMVTARTLTYEVRLRLPRT